MASSGRRALVTGGGSGIGLAVARARDVREALHIVPRIESPRILICGSLYLAGAVLRDLETAQTA